MILVTGANGFIGSYICRKLHQEKAPFIAMVRETSDLSLLEDIMPDITWHYGDILDIDCLEEVIDKVETIIHCAAIISFQPADREKMDDVNIQGTRNMVNIALNNNIQYFIHISSVAALGRSILKGKVNEGNKWESSKYNTQYGMSKYYAELEVWRGHTEGLNTVILNPSVVLGPGDWSTSSTQLFKYVWNEHKYYTEGMLNYVDVRDVAHIVFLFLKNRKSGERYIVNAGYEPYKSFFSEIAKAFGKKAPYKPIRTWMIKLALLLRPLIAPFTSTATLINKETARIGKTHIYFENSKVKRELNHTFVPMADTIAWTCKTLASRVS